MKGEALLSAMLAWRQLLASSNPDLAVAIQEGWDNWLAAQRTEPPKVSKPQLIVVADLTCTEDLTAHVGLAQVLALQNLRCSVVLSFPTAAMQRIARAQAMREAWNGLVKIVEGSERLQLLENLPADSPLAVFSGPAVMNPQSLADMFTHRFHWHMLPQRNKDGSAYRAFVSGSGYFGRAGDYLDQDAQRQDDEDTSAIDFQLLRCGAVELGLPSSSRAPLRRHHWPEANSAIEILQSVGRGIELPGVESGDELVLRTYREPLPSMVVERRSARVCAGAKSLEVRLPGILLTTAPKVIRLEAHKANGRVLGTNLLIRVSPSQLQPWMISSYLNRGGGGNSVMRAFAEGIGCRLAYAEDEPRTLSDIPVVWGVLRDSDRILAQAKAQSLYFFYIDHAYFDRGHGKSYRITRNRYEAGPIRKCPTDRLAQLGVDVAPWRKSGRDIIVCPPTEYFVQAHDCADWLDTTLAALRSFTDRPIIIREKPQPGEPAVPLKTALKSAHALVTHSSNVAIEAACFGTPVFVNPSSAAAPIGRTDLSQIEAPVYPDREPWLAHLAYSQFSIDEIREGEAWRLLLESEEREFA